MIRRRLFIIILLLGVVPTQAADLDEVFSIKEAFADHFRMGAAVNVARYMESNEAMQVSVLGHFNALTPENAMKWERIHPTEGNWNWAPADALVDLAEKHSIHLTGHTLVWHQQTPEWVFQDADGNPASRELLLQRMETQIKTVVGRYKGRVESWDVLNEAFEEDGSLRDTPWRRIIGDDYIELAFAMAHQADPDALLFYNDYNMFAPGRRQAAIAMVERLRSKGIPVHGIGMQAHMRVDYPPTLDEFEASVIAFAGLGVDVALTELDISVLPWPGEKAGGADIADRHAYEAKMNPYADGLTPEAEAALDEKWVDLFRILLRHSDKITRVTFWGINDGNTWRNNWPMRGRTDYPLLIDRDNQPKPVWQDIIALLASVE
jgi:endo-1,4-beta-xylanase